MATSKVRHDELKQAGPRAHHFSGSVSILSGLVLLGSLATTETTDVERMLAVAPGLAGNPALWGFTLIGLGILQLPNLWLALRGITVGVCTGVWSIFTLLGVLGSVIGPYAPEVTGFMPVFSGAMIGVCVLAASNLKRDFYL